MAAGAVAAALELNAVGLRVFRWLHAANAQNVVFSPYSLKVCLSMVADGATKGSVTEREMQSVLGTAPAPTMPTDGGMDMANSAWVVKPLSEIKDTYLKHVKSKFSAELMTLACPDPAPINAWVNESTKGRIEKLFEQLDPLTVLVLVNTILFKGSWASKFDAKNTSKADFSPLDGSKLKCDMMFQRGKAMRYTTKLDSQIMQLPYASGGLFAVVFLPTKPGAEALSALLEALTPEVWMKTCADLQRASCSVEFRMPRFKVEGDQDLKDALCELGMPTAFQGEAGGAFMEMTSDPSVHIDLVKQKATIEVNEEGTVAAAATGAVMMTRCAAPQPEQMTVDRPFVFAVTAADSSILFLAKVVNPSG